VYDVLGYVRPSVGAPHDGMKFSTPEVDLDLDTGGAFNCAKNFGGGWWYTFCAVWGPTTNSPVWLSLGDDTFYSMKNIRMMIKLQ